MGAARDAGGKDEERRAKTVRRKPVVFATVAPSTKEALEAIAKKADLPLSRVIDAALRRGLNLPDEVPLP